MVKQVFWLSWVIKPMDGPGVATKWPRGVRGWASGVDTSGRNIWCARVEAEGRAEAKKKIAAMYGKFASHIAWRFGPNAQPEGWWPDPTRFPR